MTETNEALQLALASLTNENEHFLDYISVTTKSDLKPQNFKNADLTQMQEYSYDMARRAVSIAQQNLIDEDIPFRKPDDFTPVMFREQSIMNRLSKISGKKQREMEQQQESRRRRLERQKQAQLQHGKRVGQHAMVKMQKEIIEKWKKERQQLASQGVSDDKLPKLEDIEKKYHLSRKVNRLNKNLKYGGNKLKKQMQKSLKRTKRQQKRSDM